MFKHVQWGTPIGDKGYPNLKKATNAFWFMCACVHVRELCLASGDTRSRTNKVLVGQGDELGGWLLQNEDFFQMSDLCNLWQQVGDQSGKPTDKPVFILVDTCYALRLGLRGRQIGSPCRPRYENFCISGCQKFNSCCHGGHVRKFLDEGLSSLPKTWILQLSCSATETITCCDFAASFVRSQSPSTSFAGDVELLQTLPFEPSFYNRADGNRVQLANDFFVETCWNRFRNWLPVWDCWVGRRFYLFDLVEMIAIVPQTQCHKAIRYRGLLLLGIPVYPTLGSCKTGPQMVSQWGGLLLGLTCVTHSRKLSNLHSTLSSRSAFPWLKSKLSTLDIQTCERPSRCNKLGIIPFPASLLFMILQDFVAFSGNIFGVLPTNLWNEVTSHSSQKKWKPKATQFPKGNHHKNNDHITWYLGLSCLKHVSELSTREINTRIPPSYYSAFRHLGRW